MRQKQKTKEKGRETNERALTAITEIAGAFVKPMSYAALLVSIFVLCLSVKDVLSGMEENGWNDATQILWIAESIVRRHIEIAGGGFDALHLGVWSTYGASIIGKELLRKMKDLIKLIKYWIARFAWETHRVLATEDPERNGRPIEKAARDQAELKVAKAELRAAKAELKATKAKAEADVAEAELKATKAEAEADVAEAEMKATKAEAKAAEAKAEAAEAKAEAAKAETRAVRAERYIEGYEAGYQDALNRTQE